MGGRIVVGFLTRVGTATTEAGDAHVQRVAHLCKKAEALGGRLCAFGSQSAAFEFAEDELEEALFLALAEPESDVLVAEQRALAPWRVGISEGDMIPLAQAGPLSRLAWGPPLVTAIALARIARPGEVLIDPEIRAVARGDIHTCGERVAKDTARGLRGLVVDKRRTFHVATTATLDDTALPAEPATDVRLLSWIDALRPSGDHEEGTGRLQAIASLTKGETAGALSVLRDGVHQAETAPAAARSRAALAYGIALAVSGRQSEALFAALEALAWARDSNEAQGARACARFLARLSSAAGFPEASSTWQRVAAKGA
jgi:hypothetical protein